MEIKYLCISILATRFTTLGRTKDTHYVATELEEDVAYEFRVRACNAEGDGEPTTIAHRHCPDINKPPSKPGTPDVYDWDKDWAELRWAPPVGDGGRPVTGYQIEKRKKDGVAKWIKIGETPMNEFRAPNLDEGEEYEFRVRAINSVGLSEPSEPSKGCVARARKSKFHWLFLTQLSVVTQTFYSYNQWHPKSTDAPLTILR